MKLHFLGANRQVTGSRYCLRANGREILIDCGLFQERQFQSRNWDRSPIPPADVDAVLLTHAHIDHIGLLPRFVREGYSGPIYGTEPTITFLETMLRDSAKIQEEDIQYKQRRHEKQGRQFAKLPEALYTDEDVDAVLPLGKPWQYGKPLEVAPGITARFFDAGHMLGSAMIEIEVVENGKSTKIVFSGDIGQIDKPIIRDPVMLERADYIVMESTYGDRLHERRGDVETQLETIVKETFARGGNVVIPTFAVERAQELMYYFTRLIQAKRLPAIKVFLDSPMAVDVTGIFSKFPAYYDEPMSGLVTAGVPPLQFNGLSMVRTAEESKRINDHRGPCVIMSSSGMCNAGRIKHHLKQNIERPESTILFVGYQSPGTLGRIILDGVPRVRIHGQEFRSLAHKAQIFGFSGHADRAGLVRWLSYFHRPVKRVFFTHGEEDVALKFAAEMRNELGLDVHVPHYRETIDL